ncbi:TPA: lipopolysaccharide biosynthesis protein [Burkholderia vietnamiensis]|nr:lipopolysaccharide biosynthesis protein [Burkholderia vietnamiensis]HDR9074233.1 lipopolysaccharide biosynthesis protein [Burkholderia vietnamiensis]HDR9204244.1 lipopolysaccharide biosynthesis protein [Burkholderia vietnamiensis]
MDMNISHHKRGRPEDGSIRSIRRLAQNGLIKVVAAGLAFVSQIALVKILGSHPYGLYVYLVTYCSLIVAISKGGIDLVALREMAVAWSVGSSRDVMFIRFSAFRYIATVGVPLAVLIALIFQWTGLFSHGQNPPNLVWVCITSISLLLLAMSLACVKGLQRVNAAEAVDSIFKPITIIIIAWIIGSLSVASSENIAYLPFVSANIVSVLALQTLFELIRRERESNQKNDDIEVRGLFEFRQAFAFTLSGLITFAYFQLATLVVAAKLGTSDAAAFNMACNFVRIVIFVALIAAGQAQPLIAAHYRRREFQSVRSTIYTCLMVSISSAVLGAIFLTIFGRMLLRSVSPDFVCAYSALIIMSAAHIFNSAILILSGALNMCGFQNNVLKAQILGLIPGAVAMALLVTPFGMTGVACSMLIALLANFIILARDSVKVFSVKGWK